MVDIPRSEFDRYEQMLRDLDPDEVERREKAVAADRRRAAALEQQAQADLVKLTKDPAFRRYLFTVLARSGIYVAVRHAQSDDYAFEAGRRALGLELLNETLGVDPQFVVDLSVEQAKLQQKVRDSEPRANPE